MSYNYKIGYTSYEESSFIELEHEKQFTADELADIVANATVEVIKMMKAVPKEEHLQVHSFQDVCSGSYKDDRINLEDCLVDKFGFKPIVYEQQFSIFGWPSIFSKEDWKSDRYESLDRLTDRVLAAGFTIEDDDYLQYREKSEKQYSEEHPEEDSNA